jgi:hypothetical protein
LACQQSAGRRNRIFQARRSLVWRKNLSARIQVIRLSIDRREHDDETPEKQVVFAKSIPLGKLRIRNMPRIGMILWGRSAASMPYAGIRRAEFSRPVEWRPMYPAPRRTDADSPNGMAMELP